MEGESRSGKDTWVGSGSPKKPHDGASALRMRSAGAYAYTRTKNPVPAGLFVVSATYTVFARKTADWVGTKQISARRTAGRKPFATMTWDTRPGVTGSTSSVSVTNAKDGQGIPIDVTAHVKAWTAGDANYGWRLFTDSATDLTIYGYDSEHPPVLSVEYATSPSQPVDLMPAGGAVSIQYPTFSFDAIDLENPSDMTDLQIQINATDSFTAPAFDTGWVPATAPIWDSTGSAWAGIADGATVYWRARFRNVTVEGDWSDPVSFSRVNKKALTILNPAAAPNNYVEEATPPFMWSFAGTQVGWHLLVTEDGDRTERVLNSRRQDGTDTAWTPTKPKLLDGGSYELELRVFDDVHRVPGGPTDPPYTVARRVFTMNDSPGITPPTMVSAEQVGGTPFVKVTVTRGTAPDAWTLLMDGQPVEAGIEPVDTLVSGTTHELFYIKASPGVRHTFQVRAVENGKSSPKSAAAAVTVFPEGVWLLDYDRERFVRFTSTATDRWERTDQAGVFTTVNGERIIIHAGDNGFSGPPFEGVLEDNEGRTAEQWVADFEWMIARCRRRSYQLVAATLSFPVRIYDAYHVPEPNTSFAGQRRDLAFFKFFEDMT